MDFKAIITWPEISREDIKSVLIKVLDCVLVAGAGTFLLTQVPPALGFKSEQTKQREAFERSISYCTAIATGMRNHSENYNPELDNPERECKAAARQRMMDLSKR